MKPYSHTHREHLGLLPGQQGGGTTETDISVEDPASDQFYLNTWMKAAHSNTQLYEEVPFLLSITKMIFIIL